MKKADLDLHLQSHSGGESEKNDDSGTYWACEHDNSWNIDTIFFLLIAQLSMLKDHVGNWWHRPSPSRL